MKGQESFALSQLLNSDPVPSVVKDTQKTHQEDRQKAYVYNMLGLDGQTIPGIRAAYFRRVGLDFLLTRQCPMLQFHFPLSLNFAWL